MQSSHGLQPVTCPDRLSPPSRAEALDHLFSRAQGFLDPAALFSREPESAPGVVRPREEFCQRLTGGVRGFLHQPDGIIRAVSRAMSDSSTLYEKLGGETGVESLVAAFYARVMRDPELGTRAFLQECARCASPFHAEGILHDVPRRPSNLLRPPSRLRPSWTRHQRTAFQPLCGPSAGNH